MYTQAGFLLILADIQTLIAPEYPPIEVFQVIPGDILAMIGKFDAEALQRAAVCAGQGTFDDKTGTDGQMPKPGQIL